MAQSDGTGSGEKEAGAAGVITAARSTSSRKSAKKPTSKGRGPSKKPKTELSDDELRNILMNNLTAIQERFGAVMFYRPPGDQPARIVLPMRLDVCQACGLIIGRGAQPYCDGHQPKEVFLDTQPSPEPGR